MKNLAHSASFESLDKDAPLKSGTKQIVAREDGSEATQMVDLADNAWHASTFSRRSVAVEMGGFASPGFDAPLWQHARVFSSFCAIIYKFQSYMRALASDRVLPRTKISALRATVITIRPTTRASGEIYWPSRR